MSTTRTRSATTSRRAGSRFTWKGSRAATPATESAGVLVRDRGAIRETYLFDTEGDDTPGGIFLELLEERVSGPHPGFFMSDDEFCAVVTPLLN